VCIVQVVKQVSAKRVVGVVRRIAGGTSKQIQSLLLQTQSTMKMKAHVAYIERLNGTFRSRIAALVRRGRALARQTQTIQQAMFLVGTVYNFCAPHKSLRRVLYLADSSPAIAAGITDHIWTMRELLAYQVPLPPWEPPKQRGRPPKRIKELINRWIL
jgi:hypothetical protein